ncbi:uncharacterized protein LOC115215539 isoform X2 [Octopus sinensis]|uniref:Uncharacterized protein LOC115215539 isoform X2 n=1 Tax=Octopus sinensis TaxID=2607531 RepID=A0A6P7SQH7_9MOLL|nr:uncharacterized protein LOC115215539 isoform X2 [Octopus sinensis]
MQQLKWLSCVALTCILLPLFVHGNADADNCSIRQALRNSVRNKLRVSCDVNDICTAVHCHGIFLENIFSPGIITKQNDTICFGTIINHCDTPLSMDVYLQYNAKSYSLKKRLYNKLNVSIYQNTYLFIELSHDKDVVPHVVTIKVSLKINMAGHTLSYPVVPEHTYTLPSCPAGAMTTPPLTLRPCLAPVFDSHTSRPELPHPQQQHHHHSEETHSQKIQYIKSATYGKPCNPKSAYSCHPKETCTFSNICECQSELVMNQFSGFCDVSDAKYEKPIQPAKPRESASSRSMHHPDYLIQNTGAPLLTENVASSTVKNSALITGLSVGAAVLLATIILVAFIIWKRQKNQTSHVPLIDNEEVVI